VLDTNGFNELEVEWCGTDFDKAMDYREEGYQVQLWENGEYQGLL